MASKHGLGRGLGALIKEAPHPVPPASPPEPGVLSPAVTRIPLSRIRKNRMQPRHRFDEAAMSELVASVREQGILQPLLVRRDGNDYELIAGERRLRAAIEVGLPDVPVVVREAADNEALLIALVENLQRENLNILEEAGGYRELAATFSLTQEQIAQRVGKSRPSISNALRVLDLPESVRTMLADGRLSAGHAKLLVAIEEPGDQTTLAERTVEDNLSVRQLEKLVQRLKRAPRKPRISRAAIPPDHLSFLSDRLHQHFGTGIRISPCRTYANGKKAKGTIEIDFYSNEDLDRLLQVMGIQL